MTAKDVIRKMPLGLLLGAEVLYTSHITARKRTGTIASVASNSIRVTHGPKRISECINYEAIQSIKPNIK